MLSTFYYNFFFAIFFIGCIFKSIFFTLKNTFLNLMVSFYVKDIPPTYFKFYISFPPNIHN